MSVQLHIAALTLLSISELCSASSWVQLCQDCEYVGQRELQTGTFTLVECKNRCDETASCVAIIVGKGNSAGQCYLESSGDGESAANTDFDTYVREWDYADTPDFALLPAGPAQWYEDAPACGTQLASESQSPIDVREATYSADLEDLLFSYADMATGLVLKNNGHTMQVDFPSTSGALTGGFLDGEYQLLQAHLHWGSTSSAGSEHVWNGKAFAAEMHFVHWKLAYGTVGEALTHSDGLAVVGVFFEAGAHNMAYDHLLSRVTDVNMKGDSINIDHGLNLNDMLPADASTRFATYSGSLTTPACSEVVVWHVLATPLTMSEAQLQGLRGLSKDAGMNPIGLNYRPLQPLNGRHITASYAPATVAPAPAPAHTPAAATVINFNFAGMFADLE